MKKPSGLLICSLILLLFLPVPVLSGEITGPKGSVPDPSISSMLINPAITTAPPSVIINPRVVRTIITPQTTGVLILESVPTHASVYIDSTLKGTTPLTLRTITTGSHEVSFRLAGYQNYTTKVTVTAGAVATVSGMLSPIITETVSRTVSPSVSVTSTVTQGTITPPPPVTTVSPPATQRTQQTSATQIVGCKRYYSGSGEMGAAHDGRLNCTVIIRSDDQIADSLRSGRYAGYRCRKEPCP